MKLDNPENLTNFYLNHWKWAITYLTFGFVFLVYFIVYTKLVFKDILLSKNKNDGSFGSQVSFIIALIVKSIGYISCGIIYSLVNSDNKDKIHRIWQSASIFTAGMPGYVVAAAYCYIFFAWCTLCVNYLSRDSISFYQKSKKWLQILMVFIFIICLISAIISLLGDKIAHTCEAMFACARDLIIALCFLFYLINISKLFNNLFKSSLSSEFHLFAMCSMLIIALTLRIAAILLYTFLFSSNDSSNIYLIVYIVEQLVIEFVPLFAIGIWHFVSTPPDQLTNSSLITSLSS
ncbi:hypothetical protein TRFO_19422 [Tritrichomonas foetus]|uniref:THH1/TOM1/TOM3 domain-containing protein n=1 Tax=Tritrichomonas foetus TaxID=1144522 RepID=A0A1J4KJB7_9EUKA|nr:hypothetical protein TRFO_19422 [Tritrichomonas foetus]|eukprot:OHT11032.1 hypothetical protein TRFO_19422 [Tritrichomonas foetus]